MRHLVFQRGETRIVEERRQPLIETRRADPCRSIRARLVERRERFVLLAERGVDRTRCAWST